MSVRSLNKVMLIGNLTRDPELRSTSSGTSVCTFGLATNRSWKDQNGETQESVTYHNIVAWQKLGELCSQLLKKGMKVYLEGEIVTSSWEKEDGSSQTKVEIRIADMIILSSKGMDGAAGESMGMDDSDAPKSKAKSKGKEDGADEIGDDDLPF